MECLELSGTYVIHLGGGSGYCIHINFKAKPNNVDVSPQLFFAEVHETSADEQLHVTICTPSDLGNFSLSISFFLSYLFQ